MKEIYEVEVLKLPSVGKEKKRKVWLLVDEKNQVFLRDPNAEETASVGGN